MQDGAAKIVAIAWSHNNMKLAVCTADRGKGDRAGTGNKGREKGALFRYFKQQCKIVESYIFLLVSDSAVRRHWREAGQVQHQACGRQVRQEELHREGSRLQPGLDQARRGPDGQHRVRLQDWRGLRGEEGDLQQVHTDLSGHLYSLALRGRPRVGLR